MSLCYRQFLTRAQVREVDRRLIQEYGVPGEVLMENAGRGAAELLVSLGIQGRVVICCGKGNNGGDGLVMARHLELRGLPVHVILLARPEELTREAAVNFRILSGTTVPITILAPFDGTTLHRALDAAAWIIDALYGTGLTGPVRSPLDRAIAAINACPARVFAVDIPSGLDCDNGLPLGPTVVADHTAAFVAMKVGFLNPQAQSWLGKVHVVDIGIPEKLWADLGIAAGEAKK